METSSKTSVVREFAPGEERRYVVRKAEAVNDANEVLPLGSASIYAEHERWRAL